MLRDMCCVIKFMSIEQPKQGQNEVQIADNIAGAEYTNFANIRHNQEEF